MFVLYTPQTANKALAQVKSRFASIASQNRHILLLHNELQQLIESGAPFERFVPKKQELNAAVTNLHKSVQELEDMGVLIKSVEEGLLDFPSKRFDQEVWLCWKQGEPEVKFWHGKEEGFMGRKPLETTGIIEP
jgi:hypothetical protein